MAVDIINAKKGGSNQHNIKIGTPVVQAPIKTFGTNNFIDEDQYTSYTRESGIHQYAHDKINSKYDTRFDDPTYYGGGGLLTDLKASYRFDEISGVRYDRSGNGIHLTDNNTVGSVSGRVGVAADFTESNTEYLSVADASLGGLSPGSTDFSISFWIYFKSTGFSGQQFVGGIWQPTDNHREWLLLYNADADNKLGFYTSANGAAETKVKTSALSHSTWYHIVVTHNNTDSSRTIYLDTVAKADDSNVTVNQGTGDFQLGNAPGSSDYFNGYLDEFNMWHKVLSTSEIATLYHGGNGKHVR